MVKDREYHNLAQKVMTKRLKTINDETGHHEINVMLDIDQPDSTLAKNMTNSLKENSSVLNNPEAVDEEVASKVPASVTTRKTRSLANSNQKQQTGSRRAGEPENS